MSKSIAKPRAPYSGSSNAALVCIALSLMWLSCQSPVSELTIQDTSTNTWPDGVAYEIFVQSFADSNGDGIGDFNGVTNNLDYLQELGIRAIWFMPIGPSPSYHKYDVLDYRDVHQDYGTIDDFRRLVEQAHARNIAIVIDLVINHTSREHPWFQASSADSTGPYSDYYVWATPEEIDATGTTKDVSEDSDNRDIWNEVDGRSARYYSYFGGHMPDLNFDSGRVREEIIDIGRFWLEEMDVDGFRLDAAKHIFPDDRADDSQAWWLEFKEIMQIVKPGVYLVGEVWSPAEEVAPYLKGLPSLFNFDLAQAIALAVNEETSHSFIQELDEIRRFYKSIEPGYRDAIFLGNHDQERIMSRLGGDKDKARLAASILMTLPGSPYIYYGEEIGMLGEKPDPSIREPFLWGGKKSRQDTDWLKVVYSTPRTVTPLVEQLTDEDSHVNHYKKLIGLRNNSDALLKGEMLSTNVGNDQIISFVRDFESESLWVVHNLSAEQADVQIPSGLGAYSDLFYASLDGVQLSEGRLIMPSRSSAIFSRQ